MECREWHQHCRGGARRAWQLVVSAAACRRAAAAAAAVAASFTAHACGRSSQAADRRWHSVHQLKTCDQQPWTRRCWTWCGSTCARSRRPATTTRWVAGAARQLALHCKPVRDAGMAGHVLWACVCSLRACLAGQHRPAAMPRDRLVEWNEAAATCPAVCTARSASMLSAGVQGRVHVLLCQPPDPRRPLHQPDHAPGGWQGC